MRILTQEFEPPEISEGAFIEGQKSLFSVVMPEATENLVANPSPVLNITGYTAMAGAVASSTTRQRRGPNSVRIAPTGAVDDGAYYGTVTTVTGWNTFSLDFWGYPGVPYKIYFSSTAPALLGTAVEFVGEGIWRRPEVKLYEAAGTTRRVYFTKNGSADTNYFYVDGLQVEAKDHSTTFCMGDMVGFVPGQTAYYWKGASYASNSVRIADTGSGGRVVPLSDYGFRLLGFTGLGMAPAANISFPYARIDGENYQTTRMEGRDFSLLGEVGGTSMSDFMGKKAQLIDAFSPKRAATRQPLMLRYQYAEDDGRTPSEDIYLITCSYIDGLKGNVTNRYREKLGLNFRMSNPDMVLDGVYGTSLDYQDSISNTTHVSARINGRWQALGIGIDNTVYAVAVDKARGRVWYAGWFVTANGVTVNNVCYWNGTTMVAVGGATPGTNQAVYGLAVMPNGDVWIVGQFTAAGGAATKGIAKWVNATDTFTVYNLTGTVTTFNAVAVDSLGNTYFGGVFTNWNGVAGNAYAVELTYDGTWTTLGTVPFSATEYPDLGRCIAVDKNNNVYFGSGGGGASGTAGHLRKWTTTTAAWSDIGATPINKTVFAVYVDDDGSVYAGGNFATFGGITVNCIFKYVNGTISALGSTPGLSGPSGAVYSIVSDGHGNLIMGGASWVNVTLYYSQVFLWNGYVFSILDTLPPSNALVYVDVWDENIYLGWVAEVATSSYAAGITSITITNAELAFPKAVFTGPTTAAKQYTLLWLENQSTKERLYFNIVINTGETVTIDFAAKKVVSDWRGVILDQPLGGSQFADFHLQRGENTLACFAYGTITGATGSVTWEKAKSYLS